MLLKRTIDVCGAAAALLTLSPVILVTAAVVAVRLGRPVLFRQVRAGYRGKPFEVLKFRTMTDATDAQGRPLPDGERLTRVGRLLRGASLDELPQLWNVLRGDMSLVGPRPLPLLYLPRYSPEQARRHEVMPGITGWAQVNGRNTLSWQEKFRLDVWYVDHRSTMLDVRIIALTVLSVLRRRGVSADGHATCGDFMGNDASAA